MEFEYHRVSPGWSEVWIVAGGPSAKAFDLQSLAGKQVLAVNDPIFWPALMKRSTAVLSLDNNWVRQHRYFLEVFEGERYIALPQETWPDCAGIPGAKYLQWGHDGGLSEDPGVIHTGGNSGYGAIGLAYLKGAKEIHLVGYDMDPADGEKYEHWAPQFRSMLPQLETRGVRVLNHNPRSFVDAFPRVGGVS